MIRNLKNSGVTEELLSFLCVAVEYQHLGRTAARLGITEPKASRLLAKARAVFSDELLVRRGHGLMPTHRARQLAERARPLLETFRALCEPEVFEPAQFDRVLHFACLDNAIPIAIEPFMAALSQRAPKAGVALLPHEESTLSRMRSGDIDFALFPARDLPSDFASAPLFRTPYVQVVRQGHPLEALLEDEKALTQALKTAPRAQITVHPDTDSTEDGVPGPATLPLSARETRFWSPFWLGTIFLALRRDLVITIPWRTALALCDWCPMTALARAQPGLWLEPHLIWHRHTAADPALAWVRCTFLEAFRPAGETMEDVWQKGPLTASMRAALSA